jgi:hypothetical protein
LREAFSTFSASRFWPLESLPSSSYFIHVGTLGLWVQV